MTHLEDVTQSQLQQALEQVKRKQPTQRLTAAIAYKNGVTQTELANWYDVERKTIYNWLTRLEEDSLLESATDEHRSGRDRKLSQEQLTDFQEILHESPVSAGFEAPAWTPTLAQKYLREEFDVDYSIPSCRRLLKEAGLTYKKPRQEATEADPDEGTEIHEKTKTSAGIWTPK